MANKNLIKRAFSVTAALPVSAAQNPESSSPEPDGTAPPAAQATDRRVVVPVTLDAVTAAPQVLPRTGPGSMLAFMAEQSEVHKEVVQLRERVAGFRGADIARRLDPAKIRQSAWANRDAAHYASDEFASLKEEIASAGGNVQPIKVRAVSGAATEEEGFEIVFGHRRHRACLDLGLPVLALVQNEMKDEELFVEMERENRNRADLSAWEQGMMYLQALERGLFPSAKQLAAAIDRDTGNIGRAMALAKLPSDVVAAFGSPLNLQFRWATPLKDAHQRDPEGLLNTARDLAERKPRPSPAEVFATLTQPTQTTAVPSTSRVDWKDSEGTAAASLVRDRKGRVALSFEQPMNDAQVRRLKKLVDDFIGIKA
jgi:ParB family chromosome partitioning protein